MGIQSLDSVPTKPSLGDVITSSLTHYATTTLPGLVILAFGVGALLQLIMQFMHASELASILLPFSLLVVGCVLNLWGVCRARHRVRRDYLNLRNTYKIKLSSTE